MSTEEEDAPPKKKKGEARIRIGEMEDMWAHPVYPHELEALQGGGTAAVLLNIALSLTLGGLGIGSTLATANASLTGGLPQEWWAFTLMGLALVLLVVGAVLGVIWLTQRKKTAALVKTIKNRKPKGP